MQIVKDVSEAINNNTLKPKSVVYCAGNAATPQVLLEGIANDESIEHIALYSVLLLGERIKPLFSQATCQRITHRIIFNSHYTREAVNRGWAKYHPMHLSEIPKYALASEGFDVVLLTDAIRAVEVETGDGARAIDAMRGLGVSMIATTDLATDG